MIALPATGVIAERVKWAALALMVGDHIDTGLFRESLGFHDTLGRMVFPAFAVMFAWARAHWMHNPQKQLMRLALACLLAQPAAMWLFPHAWAMLNIMGTFFIAAIAGNSLAALEPGYSMRLRDKLPHYGILTLAAVGTVYVEYILFGPLAIITLELVFRGRWPPEMLILPGVLMMLANMGDGMEAMLIAGMTTVVLGFGMIAAQRGNWQGGLARGQRSASHIATPAIGPIPSLTGFYLFYPLHLYLIIAGAILVNAAGLADLPLPLPGETGADAALEGDETPL